MEIDPEIKHRSNETEPSFHSSAKKVKWTSDANRDTARKTGVVPVIPWKSNRRDNPRHFAKVLCRGRARIEQMMGKLKRLKRVSLR